jgi:hypothetical protein
LRILYAAVAIAFTGSIVAVSSPALAEILQISATGMVKRCPCDPSSTDTSEEDNGVLVLKGNNVRYFTPVALSQGQRVCSFSMLYNDVNANDTMTARLERKNFTVGGNPFILPVTMATVKSAGGVPDTVRKATQTTIKAPLINAATAFYYIELDAPTVNLNVLGFQIDVRQTCPAPL